MLSKKLGVYLSKKICQYVANFSYGVGPDVKSQVIVDYSNEKPLVKHILVSTMHQNETLDEIRDIVTWLILENQNNFIDIDTYENHILNNDELVIDVNPCGSWEIGGPVADCGVTGRKIVVDQFGGYCNVGGGAFSGKDGSKIDVSASYTARYIAKNIVAAGLSNTCKVTLSYMIGIPDPSSFDIEVDTNIDVIKLELLIRDNIDLTPRGITERFNLKKPIYYNTARFGHYGNTTYPWEQLDLVDYLKKNF